MQIQPYLFFDGRCEEAIEFYKRAVGAQVEMLMRNKEAPEQPPPGTLAPGSENKVMHASFRVGDSTILASDGHATGKPSFQGFALSLMPASESEARQKFEALSAGGKVDLPLNKTFFSPAFGMLHDKFGVQWMVFVAPQR